MAKLIIANLKFSLYLRNKFCGSHNWAGNQLRKK